MILDSDFDSQSIADGPHSSNELAQQRTDLAQQRMDLAVERTDLAETYGVKNNSNPR